MLTNMWQLYKYQSINKCTLSNLAQDKLWASQASAFNDPFELRLQKSEIAKGIDVIRKFNPQLDNLSDSDLIKKATEIFESEIKKFSIVCFTIKPNDILMWAHYADSYKGFCLGFKEKNDKEVLSDIGIYKVNYQYEYSIKDFTKIWYKDGLSSIIWTKFKEWEYEEEYRRVLVKENQLTDYPGILNKIIFGLRTSDEDIKLVQKIVNDKPDIEYCKIVQNDDSYQLQINGI